MKWASKVEQAIKLAENIDQIQYIEDRIDNSPYRPNYRTKEGRQIKEELLAKCQEKAQKLISQGETPFES